MYLDDKNDVINGKSLYSHYAVGVLGTVGGLMHALPRWGSMPLSKVMAPAIALAEKCPPVSGTLAKNLEQSKKVMDKWPAAKAIFWRNGAPLKTGEPLYALVGGDVNAHRLANGRCHR